MVLGHSREISCFSFTTWTDFLIVPILKTQYNLISTSALSAFEKHIGCVIVSAAALSCAFTVVFCKFCTCLHWFSSIFRTKNRIFSCYGLKLTMNNICQSYFEATQGREILQTRNFRYICSCTHTAKILFTQNNHCYTAWVPAKWPASVKI